MQAMIYHVRTEIRQSSFRYALNSKESLRAVLVCNQKLMELAIIEVIKGICPNSLLIAKFEVLERMPSICLQNLVNVLSNSLFPLNDISNISLIVLL